LNVGLFQSIDKGFGSIIFIASGIHGA
jgi:hypothetical protein